MQSLVLTRLRTTHALSRMEQLIDFETLKFWLLSLAIGLWLYWLWSRRHLYKFSMKLPGPLGLPIIGIGYRITNSKAFLTFFTKAFEEYKEDTVCAWLGVECALITRDPETIKNILSSPKLLNKPKFVADTFTAAFTGGILVSPVDKWQHNRKLINPSFNHKVLLNLLPIFNKNKQTMISRFSSIVGMGEKKLSHIVQQTSLEVTAETTMGKIMKEGDEGDSQLIKSVDFMLEASIYLLILSLFRLQWLYFFYTRYKKNRKYCHDLVHEVIKSKLQTKITNSTRVKQSAHSMISSQNMGTDKLSVMAPSEDMGEDDILSIKKQPNIFIEQAIQLHQKNKFTLNDIIAESLTIATGSYETTANGIFNTLVMLAMHPDVQEKLYEEIVDVFPDKDFEMTNDDISKLPYLDMVVNESLRLMPPAPLIARQVVTDTELTKDIHLPKGLGIVICIFQLHRNTKVWGKNAHKFNPDNFLPENLSTIHSHAFIPFSKGARNCIGWRYAYLAMKTMIVGAVRNFRFSTSFKFEDLQWMEHVTLKYLVEPEIEIHNR